MAKYESEGTWFSAEEKAKRERAKPSTVGPLPGGLLADIEYVGPDTVRILRTYMPRPQSLGEGRATGSEPSVQSIPRPADPLDKVLTLRDLKEIHQQADAIPQFERGRAPAPAPAPGPSYITRAINARVFDAAKAAAQTKPDPVPTLELRHRRAAAALLAETAFAPLTWWIEGGKHTVRDADGTWYYHAAKLQPYTAPCDQLERVYQTALMLAKQGL